MAPRRRPRSAHALRPLIGVGLVVGLLVMVWGGTPVSSATSAGSTAWPDVGGRDPISASVTWNGANVSPATSVGQALPVTFTPPISLHFLWTSTVSTASGPPGSVTVGAARLEVYYFGFALLSPTVVESNPQPRTSGEVYLNWSPAGLQYLIAGAYRATAQLLGSSGDPIWNETFYFDAQAPYVVGAALPILFLLLVALELVSVARSGRYDRGPAPHASPPSPPGTGGGAGAPGDHPPGPGTPPSEGSP